MLVQSLSKENQDLAARLQRQEDAKAEDSEKD